MVLKNGKRDKYGPNNVFIYLNLFLAVLGFGCCARAFSRCSKQGLLSHCGARASHCSSFSCCRAQALGAGASVVATCGLSN